jgi:hypothetical protein
MKLHLLGKTLPVFFILTAMAIIDEPKEIPLWKGAAPGSEGKSGLEKVRISEEGDHVISNIHVPSISHLTFPQKKKQHMLP